VSAPSPTDPWVSIDVLTTLAVLLPLLMFVAWALVELIDLIVDDLEVLADGDR